MALACHAEALAPHLRRHRFSGTLWASPMHRDGLSAHAAPVFKGKMCPAAPQRLPVLLERPGFQRQLREIFLPFVDVSWSPGFVFSDRASGD